MIAPSGTFDYVSVVPESVSDNGFECQAARREPSVNTGDDAWDMRLVGDEPILRVVDAGLTPDPGIERPRVMRSMISLIAADRRAMMASASFHVDKALTSCMRAGDVVHVTRTESAGIGLSVLRQGTLVVAAGAGGWRAGRCCSFAGTPPFGRNDPLDGRWRYWRSPAAY